MSRCFRFVLLWLLALALPVQGLASAAMLHCAGSHERMHGLQGDAGLVAGVVGARVSVDVATHHGAHDHGHPTMAAAHDGHDPDPGRKAGDPLTDQGTYSCSACAACCSACALSGSVTTLATPDFAPTVFAALAYAADAFAAEGPERPPRLLSV